MIITRLFYRLKQMPNTLAMLTCVFTLFGSLCVCLAILPFDGLMTQGGRPLSYNEFWESGGGVLFILAGLVMVLFAMGFYKAQRWVRYAVPVGFIAMTVYSLLRPDPVIPSEWVGTLFWAILSFWYFYRKRTVVNYFSQARAAKA